MTVRRPATALAFGLTALSILACNERPRAPESRHAGAVPSAHPSAGPTTGPATASVAATPNAPDARPDDPGYPGECAIHADLANQLGPARDYGDGDEWATLVRDELIEPERVGEIIGPIAWRAIDALANRRFDTLSSMVGLEGVCLRAAKGARCIQLTKVQVAQCAKHPKKWDFPVDSGDDGPHLMTCGQAIDRIFFQRDLRRPTTVTYNCIPAPGRGNNGSSVILRSASAFVEFRADQVERQPWLSLWLVFDTRPGAEEAEEECSLNATGCDDRMRRLYMVELIAEYWGI